MKAFDSGTKKKNHSIVYDFFVIQQNSNIRAPSFIVRHFARIKQSKTRSKIGFTGLKGHQKKKKIYFNKVTSVTQHSRYKKGGVRQKMHINNVHIYQNSHSVFKYYTLPLEKKTHRTVLSKQEDLQQQQQQQLSVLRLATHI